MQILEILFYPFKKVIEFFQHYFKASIVLIVLFVIFSPFDVENIEIPNLKEIRLEGMILDARGVLDEIEKAKDSNIKGVLFVVDSPGGLIAPSIEISMALKELANEKKIVVYASGTLASGSYYASIYGDKIIANPGSMVGSIGVIFNGANIEEITKKIGIKTQIIKAGEYKEAGTFYREWSAKEKEMMENLVAKQYDMFVDDVAKARGLDVNNHKEFADGKVFTAYESKELGLIDEVASYGYAKSELIRISEVTNPIWVKKDKVDEILDRLEGKVSSAIISTIFSQIIL